MHQAACEHYLLVLQIILVTQTTQALPENIDILTLWRLRNFSLKYPCKCKLAVQRLVEASKINTCMQESAESRRWHSFGTRGKDLIIITIAQIYITFELQIQSFLFFWKFFSHHSPVMRARVLIQNNASDFKIFFEYVLNFLPVF